MSLITSIFSIHSYSYAIQKSMVLNF
jgi:hypothetical protein